MALTKIPRRMLVPDLTSGDVTLSGADPTGVADSTAAIAAAAAAAGFVVLPAGNYKVTTATLDCPIHFEPGAYLTVVAANTYTITGPITSSRQHIFRGSGLVVCSSDSNSGENSRMVHVSWFGAFPSSSAGADQAPLIQKACTAMGTTRESEIEFDFGNYHIFTGPITVTRGCHIKGPGTRRCVFRLNADGFTVFQTGEVACKFSNIQFEVEAPLTHRMTGSYISILHGECEIYDVQCYAAAHGITVAANNCRINNIAGTYGDPTPDTYGAGTALVHIASGSNSRVSNIVAGTSTFGPASLVLLGGSAGGSVSGAIVENISHINPSASLFIEATAGNVVRCSISGIVYNGSSGTAPAYAVKFETGSTFGISDIALSNAVVASYATNGIHFKQASSGTMEDISLDGVDITGSSGIGINFDRTAGTLQDIRIGDTVNVTERATPYSYTGTSTVAMAKIAPMAVPDAGPAVCWTWTIADDTVQVINLQRSVFTGVGVLSCAGTHHGMFLVRAASSPAVVAMTTPSASVASTTGVLTGTTGTDTKLTLSADDKVIYIENRLGSSQAVHFTLLTGL